MLSKHILHKEDALGYLDILNVSSYMDVSCIKGHIRVMLSVSNIFFLDRCIIHKADALGYIKFFECVYLRQICYVKNI